MNWSMWWVDYKVHICKGFNLAKKYWLENLLIFLAIIAICLAVAAIKIYIEETR